MVYQLHHMLPKHSEYFAYLGDVKEDPYYKVLLTPEGHAQQHDILYRVFRNNFDKIACNGIRGDCDARRETLSECGKRGGKAKPSAASIEKMRQSKLGKKLSKEHKDKIAASNRGKEKPPRTDEHKENIAKSLIGNTRRKNGKKTWKPDDEYKAKMSAALKGKKKPPFTAEHKRKLSEAAKRRKKNKDVL